MLHKFKIYGQRYVIDTQSMAFHKLSELEYDMLEYIKLPPEDAFPSSLRYDLAKYESSKLAEAYKFFSRLWADGVLASDTPLTVKDEAYPSVTADKVISFNGQKFIFANEVIKAADEKANIISVKEEKENPVKAADYDILVLEYERTAKEIIKRRTGRIQGNDFDFIPFLLPFSVDEKGYTHISDSSLSKVIESGNEVEIKVIECAVAVKGI